ncbi:peptide ABC transporter permease [Candidatus Marsarchaeota G2 archaeon ECH_B_2]|uniref:Peptide ABC transporter permease n=3 Tax=Candidatus Marsarchaeota group 2 TaxID=2203771 RepID=A0A2R6B9H7_9ARCH|nr:MAG: peptide ABC transporter permease [Candidatus Marsarchaeota G2 archaeon ECH_B_2]PSN99940.1 MAG: peptide ABC transporter permease [Candidatus Marsarchaeota G2 archaeon ECH_B_3]PSO02144.1 MAG: peptide ABC transporter permease [Candidatus Marsarchaeota G2 archaeon ECH_B_1]
MRMGRYIAKRALTSIITFFAVLVLTFILFRLLPGNPVLLLFRNPQLTQQQIAQLSAQFGLNRPLYEQFILFIVNVFRGNLGLSFYYRAPVTQVLFPALLNSIILILPSTILAILIGVGLGVISGWKRNTLTDMAVLSSSLVLYAIPTFWLGILLIMLAVRIGGIPVSGMLSIGVSFTSPTQYLGNLLRHLLLPMITLTLVTLGQFSIIMRTSVINELTEDYVVAAYAKGMSESRLIRKHVVPNALLPTVSIIAISIGTVVAGAVLTETVFSWPGVGTLIYDSIARRDYPVLQGAFLIVALSVIISNFIADLVYAYLDPRVKYS